MTTFNAPAFAKPEPEAFIQGETVEWSLEPRPLPLIVSLPLIAVVSASLWVGIWRLVASVLF